MYVYLGVALAVMDSTIFTSMFAVKGFSLFCFPALFKALLIRDGGMPMVDGWDAVGQQ